MRSDSVSIKEVVSGYQYRIKPNTFLVDGVRIFAKLKQKKALSTYISDYSSDIYRPGIFKRIFVNDLSHGLPYITAQAMMTENPRQLSKILSTKMTENIEPMILHHNTILVSCAGTIGNVRLICKSMDGTVGSQDIIRVVPKEKYGFVYAYLSSRQVYSYLQSQLYGSVVPRIEPETVSSIPIPFFSNEFVDKIDNLIKESAILRDEATEMLSSADSTLMEKAGLKKLDPDDYDYYGHHSFKRKVSCFTKNIKEIGSTSINAFNHSRRIDILRSYITCNTIPLKDAIINGQTFSSSGAPSIEVEPGKGIMLINQKDIFDNIIKGKWISSRGVKQDNLVSYGEVLIACDGTLAENELFCRTIFANEDLTGAFISSHFIRMKSNDKIKSGYLYCWLNSDYGFRLIRNTQAGTKLCHPINKLLLEIPVPVINEDDMNYIDQLVKTANTKKHKANSIEKQAIKLVEQEIEKWNK